MPTKLICPNCGAPLDIAKRRGNVIKCSCCGIDTVIESLSDEAAPSSTSWTGEVRFFSPVGTVEQFEQKCQRLFDEDPLLPDDIFHEIDFKDVRRVYLPLWTIGTICNGNVSWKVGNEYKNQNINIKHTYLSLAAKDNCVPSDVLRNVTVTDFRVAGTAEEMDSAELFANPPEGFEIEQSRIPYNRRMREFEHVLLDRICQDIVNDSNVSNVNNNLQLTTDKYFDENNDVIFVPFYIVEFDYKGKRYSIAADATGGNFFAYNLPVDRERKRKLDNTFPTWAIASICVIAFAPPALWLFGPLTFGMLLKLLIPAVIAIGIIAFIATTQANKTRDAIIASAREARKQ